MKEHASPDRQMLDPALEYGGRGHPVLPLHEPVGGTACCSCGNPRCPSPGKHPRTQHGLNDATTDPGQINEWWSIWPTANIGVVTGAVSGFDVVDCDPRNGSERSLSKLGDLPDTPTVRTGGGGQHLFLKHVPGTRCRTSLLPGIDLKADGGYVVAPPSLHQSGGRYSWIVTFDEQEPAPAPKSVLELLERPRSSGGQINMAIREGLRNDHLFRLGCSMRARHATPTAIAHALHEANARCTPPLSGAEVRCILRSVERYRDVKPHDADESCRPDLSTLSLTHLGFGRLMLERHGHDLHFCGQWKRWLAWDGARWAEDYKARAERFVTHTQEWLKSHISSAITDVQREIEEENETGPDATQGVEE